MHFYQRQQCRASSARTFDTDFTSQKNLQLSKKFSLYSFTLLCCVSQSGGENFEGCHAILCRETACDFLSLGTDEKVEYESPIDIFFKQSICINESYVNLSLGIEQDEQDAATCLAKCNDSGQDIALLSPETCVCGSTDMINQKSVKVSRSCEACEGQPGKRHRFFLFNKVTFAF